MTWHAVQALSEFSPAALRTSAEAWRARRDAAALASLRVARVALADFILQCSVAEALRYWAGEVPQLVAPLAESMSEQRPSWWHKLTGRSTSQQAATSATESIASIPFDELHAILMGAGLRDLARTTNDEDCLARIRRAMQGAGEPGAVERGAMAAMLFAGAHELPAAPDLSAVADGFRGDYVVWLLTMPALFHRVGEADQYLVHLRHAVSRVHAFVMRRPRPSGAEQVAAMFAGASNFVQSCFNTENLSGMMARRGDIIVRALQDEGRWLLTTFIPAPPDARQRKIRLGLLARHYSPQTDVYFLISHFEHLNRSRFDITLFALEQSGHALEKHCFAAADRVVLLAAKDLGAQVERIRAESLDVLLFGSNVSAVVNAEAVLATHRLARIQVASVSSPVTTGIAQMDVMLSAEWNEPDHAAGLYTEHLHCLPAGLGTYAFQYDRNPATINMSRELIGLRAEQRVFFSGANYYKIVPELVESWARILASVPDSALLLMPFNPSWSAEYQTIPFMERIHSQMQRVGVDAARIKVLAAVPTRADLQRVVALADVYLDAFPFAGACSMVDPLQAGVPPVAWYGNTARSRHGMALLRMVGLQQWCADSAAQYEELAIRLALDAGLRTSIRARLLDLQMGSVLPPYLDTADFSTRVGTALEALVLQAGVHDAALCALDEASLRQRLQRLADRLVGGEPELDNLSDEWIARHLALPYLQTLQTDGRTPLLIDVGACFGSMAQPFLEAGWRAVMFEPDPDARRVLEQNVASHALRTTVVAAAVGNEARDRVKFYKNSTAGLSGLSSSPFGSTQQLIEVPAVRLADWCRQAGIENVDFLKIDAEGHDFDVLDGFDFTTQRPALVLVEFGTQFARQTLQDVDGVLERMRSSGYGAVAFCYADDGAFARGVWSYRLTGLCTDAKAIARVAAAAGGSAFGNIVFHRAGDTGILRMLIGMLEGCLPQERFAGQGAAGEEA